MQNPTEICNMANKKSLTYAGFLTNCLIFFLFIGTKAQSDDSEMEKLFSSTEKVEHNSYMLKYSNKETNYYWIDNDTLYSCGGIIFSGGSKIALSDIDFTKKSIIKTDMLVKNTLDPVYKLKFVPIKGKPTYHYTCYRMGSFYERSGNIYINGNSTLDMATRRLADQAFDYLQRRSQGGIKKISAQDPAKATGNFDSQLFELINGVKDNFVSLKSSQTIDNENVSKIQLEGSISTRIHTGMALTVSLMADFGDFNTLQEAEAVLEKVSAKISQSRKMPVTMIKQDEVVNSISKTITWLPFGDVDPELKGFSLDLYVMSLTKLDKNFNRSDYHTVKLRIKK